MENDTQNQQNIGGDKEIVDDNPVDQDLLADYQLARETDI